MEHRDVLYQRLLEDHRYVSWLLGEAPEDDEYWRDWAAQDPVRPEVMEQTRLTIQAIQGRPVTMSKQEIANRVQQALHRAKVQELSVAEKRGRVRSLVSTGYRWAAAASVTLLLGWLAYSHYATLEPETPAGPTYSRVNGTNGRDQLRWVVNSNRAAQHVLLPDGSSVVLRRASQIGYTPVFGGGKREVYLSGEAFFEVTKDATKPFFVYANGLVTKVLGTSFNVKAHQQAGQVIVAVKTGKVAVFAQTDPKAPTLRDNRELTGMVLMPNQQATFERADARLTRTTVEVPIEHQSFAYRSTPIAEVFASLEKAYGVTIVFNRETMAHCSLSATLGDEPLQKKLDWICSILEATYQMKEQQVIVTGKACQ